MSRLLVLSTPPKESMRRKQLVFSFFSPFTANTSGVGLPEFSLAKLAVSCKDIGPLSGNHLSGHAAGFSAS
jgi:hypothetical protein